MANLASPILDLDTHLEGNFSSTQVKQLALEEVSFFGGLCLPDDFTLAFPEYYRILWKELMHSLLKVRSFDKYGLGFPRGHAKTSFAKLLVAAIVFLTQNNFVLVTCANQDLAKNIIKDVCDILDSPQVRSVFGNWREDVSIDRAELKMFRFGGRKVVLAAAGVGTSIRGFNLGNARPDVMIFDDAQTRECAASVTESKNFQQWFFGTALKARSPKRCTYLYIGNMYRDVPLEKDGKLMTCLLRNLQRSPHWKSFIVGALLVDGTALWEELHPREQLLADYEHDCANGQGDIFAAEVMNDPTYRPNVGLDMTKVKVVDTGTDLHQGSYIIVDPAGKGKNSDDTSIGYYEVFDGRPACKFMQASVISSVQTAWAAVGLAVRTGCNLIAIENTAYQASLLEWVEYVMMQSQVHGIQVVPINSGGRSKNGRIVASVKEVNAGNVMFTQETFGFWFSQLSQFDVTRSDNRDDILDNVAYAPDVLARYRHLLVLPSNGMLPPGLLAHVPAADDSAVAF